MDILGGYSSVDIPRSAAGAIERGGLRNRARVLCLGQHSFATWQYLK
jgi:hypothetical protein